MPPVTPGFVLMQQLPEPLVPMEKGKEENQAAPWPCPGVGAGGLQRDPSEGQSQAGQGLSAPGLQPWGSQLPFPITAGLGKRRGSAVAAWGSACCAWGHALSQWQAKNRAQRPDSLSCVLSTGRAALPPPQTGLSSPGLPLAHPLSTPPARQSTQRPARALPSLQEEEKLPAARQGAASFGEGCSPPEPPTRSLAVLPSHTRVQRPRELPRPPATSQRNSSSSSCLSGSLPEICLH